MSQRATDVSYTHLDVYKRQPHLSWLDSSDPESLLRQLPVLGAGILIYVVSVFSAYHIAVKRYENVNL